MTTQLHTDEQARTRATEVATAVARLARSILGDTTEVIWFGSWPKGTAQARSDIDLAVSTGAPIPLDLMNTLLAEVEELPTLYQIDVIDLHAVGSALRAEVLKYGEPL